MVIVFTLQLWQNWSMKFEILLIIIKIIKLKESVRIISVIIVNRNILIVVILKKKKITPSITNCDKFIYCQIDNINLV